jgi:putative transposase
LATQHPFHQHLICSRNPDPNSRLEARVYGEGSHGKSPFTEEHIIHALRLAEGGTPVKEICRILNIAEQTYYRWKREFAGMGVAEFRRLKQLEGENRKLKGLVADLTLDKHMLQEVLGHASLATTSIYVSLSKRAQKKALQEHAL